MLIEHMQYPQNPLQRGLQLSRVRHLDGRPSCRVLSEWSQQAQEGRASVCAGFQHLWVLSEAVMGNGRNKEMEEGASQSLE